MPTVGTTPVPQTPCLATPSAAAAAATPAPTKTAASRIVLVGGYTAPFRNCSSVTNEANVVAADRNMPSVQVDAPDAKLPSAIPGKINALFAKPGAR